MVVAAELQGQLFEVTVHRYSICVIPIMHVVSYMSVCLMHTHICTGDQWHLRRTNWCREAVEVLEDEVSIIFVSLYSITSLEPRPSAQFFSQHGKNDFFHGCEKNCAVGLGSRLFHHYLYAKQGSPQHSILQV